MNKTTKIIICIALITILLMTTVFAAGVKKNIEVMLNSVNLTVNGKKVVGDTIVYNGVTYVPLRATAEMLGKEVGWDQKTNTVSVNDKGAVISSTNYSRTNPAPIGAVQTASVENIFSNSTLDITIVEVVRGAKADEMIKADNQFSYSEPQQGYENMLVKIKAKAIDVKDDKKVDVNQAIFVIYTEGNEKYGYDIVIGPEPRLQTSLYKGAETEGWAAYQVKIGDKPKLGYGQNYDGTGGVWFKLY